MKLLMMFVIKCYDMQILYLLRKLIINLLIKIKILKYINTILIAKQTNVEKFCYQSTGKHIYV